MIDQFLTELDGLNNLDQQEYGYELFEEDECGTELVNENWTISGRSEINWGAELTKDTSRTNSLFIQLI